jgi:hypothetical protein
VINIETVGFDILREEVMIPQEEDDRFPWLAWTEAILLVLSHENLTTAT